MISDSINTTGELTITLIGKDGNVKQQATVPNMVVATGKTFITASMAKTTSNTPAAMSHMALGSGVTAPVTGNTTLQTEFTGGSNVRATLSATPVGNVITYTATFAPGNCTGAVTEAGIFNGATASTMLCRTVFSVFNKDAPDTLIVSWNITNV